MVWDGARSGLVGRGVSGYIGSTLAKLEAVDVSSSYLYYFLQGQYGYINTNTKGVGIPHVDPAVLKAIPFPVAPRDQQAHIVAEIEKQFYRLDEAVTSLKRVKANLKRYKAAVLKAAVEGKLTEEWRQQNPDVEPASKLLERILAERRTKWEEAELAKMKAKGKEPKDDKWKEKYKPPEPPKMASQTDLVSEGWALASVDQLGSVGEQPVLTGPFGSHMGKSDFQDSGVPVLTIGCLKEEGIAIEKAKFVSSKKAEELKRYTLRVGDLLFSRMAAVGRVGFVTAEHEGSIFNYHIMRLRLCASVVDPQYFISYVRGAELVNRYVRDVNHGATRDGINTEQLLALPVALPPLNEQDAIRVAVSAKFEYVLRVMNQIDLNLIRAERMKQSVLAAAFSGG